MDLFLRLMMVLLRAVFAPERIALEDAAMLRFRVAGADLCDGVLKQARYSSFADLGVVHFLARAGVLSVVRKKGWSPLLAAREVDILRHDAGRGHLEMETCLVGWDERYTCFVHRLCFDGVQIAEVRSVGRLAARGDRSPLIAKMLELLGRDPDERRSPPGSFNALMTAIADSRKSA